MLTTPIKEFNKVQDVKASLRHDMRALAPVHPGL